jgi:hypothetical protein
VFSRSLRIAILELAKPLGLGGLELNIQLRVLVDINTAVF